MFLVLLDLSVPCRFSALTEMIGITSVRWRPMIYINLNPLPFLGSCWSLDSDLLIVHLEFSGTARAVNYHTESY